MGPMALHMAIAFLAAALSTRLATSSPAEWKAAGVFSRSEPGPWKGLEAMHVPNVSPMQGNQVVVGAMHAMTEDHYITAQWLEDASGNVIEKKDLTPSSRSANMFIVSSAEGPIV